MRKSDAADLAYRVLDHIDAHPESHHQGWWLISQECGTTGCFAGLICLLSGDRPDFGDPDSPFSPQGGWTYGSAVVTASGQMESVDVRAGNLLGLDSPTADRLFHAGNSRADLGELVEGIFGPRQDDTVTRPYVGGEPHAQL